MTSPPNTAPCQVCGEEPGWKDMLSGDHLCQRCGGIFLIPRFLVHTGGRFVAIQIPMDVKVEPMTPEEARAIAARWIPRGTIRGVN